MNYFDKNIIFDWSGVISNDISIVLSTYNEIFSIYDKPSLSHEEFQDTFELPYENFCRKILGDNINIFELQEHFRRIYIKNKMIPTVIPGSETVLDILKQNNVRMTVLSSHSFVSIEAEHFFPGKNYFTKIFEDVPDKTKCIHILMDELNFEPINTYYVGDMVHDIYTGKQAGVKTVGITTGYQSREILTNANPDYILDNLRELLSLLQLS